MKPKPYVAKFISLDRDELTAGLLDYFSRLKPLFPADVIGVITVSNGMVGLVPSSELSDMASAFPAVMQLLRTPEEAGKLRVIETEHFGDDLRIVCSVIDLYTAPPITAMN